MMPITTDKSIYDKTGRLRFCSIDKFVSDICEGDHCFICGRHPSKVPFNREHVIPNWLLRNVNIHSGNIQLPNGRLHRYGSYTIPCCTECNTGLAEHFEKPISEAFGKGFSGLSALVEREGTERLFQWMALLFVKMHLKDKTLLQNPDTRLGRFYISDGYDWSTFHHMHCLARAHYSGAKIGKYVHGSMLFVEVGENSEDEFFDIATVSSAYTLYIRVKDIAIYTAFDDSGICLEAVEPVLSRITGVMNSAQARELAAELAAANIHLKNPPSFGTRSSNADGDDLEIIALPPEGNAEFFAKSNNAIGHIKRSVLGSFCQATADHTREEALELLGSNEYSFLFNSEGVFVTGGDKEDLQPVRSEWSAI
ncbi:MULTISPECIES: hypothetical protein [Acetobacteraceae]|uniref:hypothetical protein n=1 Tax=Acetobacteraceae TaxID=433 RepID=UPI00031437BE|nr:MULTISPECIES: hypothetical protein [Acetobacteraceae]GCD57356.1 hypothetical protein NBRC3222_2693 [Acetobacter pasteurianus NBRC 3222]